MTKYWKDSDILIDNIYNRGVKHERGKNNITEIFTAVTIVLQLPLKKWIQDYLLWQLW